MMKIMIRLKKRDVEVLHALFIALNKKSIVKSGWLNNTSEFKKLCSLSMELVNAFFNYRVASLDLDRKKSVDDFYQLDNKEFSQTILLDIDTIQHLIFLMKHTKCSNYISKNFTDKLAVQIKVHLPELILKIEAAVINQEIQTVH